MLCLNTVSTKQNQNQKQNNALGAPGWVSRWNVRLLVSGLCEFEPHFWHKDYSRKLKESNCLPTYVARLEGLSYSPFWCTWHSLAQSRFPISMKSSLVASERKPKSNCLEAQEGLICSVCWLILCQLAWAMGCLDIWSNVILSVSVRVFSDETNI